MFLFRHNHNHKQNIIFTVRIILSQTLSIITQHNTTYIHTLSKVLIIISIIHYIISYEVT